MLYVREFTEKSSADFILFRMHEGVISYRNKLDISIQMAVEHVLAQKLKESAK